MNDKLYYATGMFLSENSFKGSEEEALQRAKDMFWMDDDYIVVFEVKKMYKVSKELEEVNVQDAMKEVEAEQIEFTEEGEK